jgi:hypothetical protein
VQVDKDADGFSTALNKQAETEPVNQASASALTTRPAQCWPCQLQASLCISPVQKPKRVDTVFPA